MNKSEGRAIVFTAVLSLVAITVAVLWVLYPALKTENAASWVQAFGSIGAILFAWWLGENQSSRQDRQRRIEESNKRLAAADLCVAVADDATIVASHTYNRFDESRAKWFEIGTERVEEMQNAVRILLAKEITPELFSALLPIQRELAYTFTAIRQYNLARDFATFTRIRQASLRMKAMQVASLNMQKIAEKYRAEIVDQRCTRA